VASPITHALIGLTVPLALLGRRAGLPVTLLSAACSVVPDFDKVVGKLLQGLTAVSIPSVWSHRGISHSLLFALVLALLATFLARRRRWSSMRWGILFPLFFFATVSHGLIDVFVGTYGVALLAPFSAARYLHPVGTIHSINFWQYFSPALYPVLLQEVLWLWIPFSMFLLLARLAVVRAPSLRRTSLFEDYYERATSNE
jgi:inner membrane protein